MHKRSLIAVVLAVLLLPLSAVAGVQAAPGGGSGPKLHLQIGSFDPAAGTGPSARGVRAIAQDAPVMSTPGRPTTWAVQATAPEAQADMVAAIQASGAHILGYMPDQAYAVYATPEQRTEFVNAVGPLVRFSGPYQPSWRLRPALGQTKAVTELSGANTFVVDFFPALPAEAKAAAFGAVAAVPGVRVERGEAGDNTMRIVASSDQLAAVATVPEVSWVNTPAKFELLNAAARWVTDTGSRETLHLTKPVGGLTGKGQTAAVADTGFNYIPDSKGDAQAYFSDCTPACKEADFTQAGPGVDQYDNVVANATGHRKMAAYFDLGASGARPADADSHGTHVAGSVAGNIAPTNDITKADGMAWEARLVHQNTADTAGGLGGIPDDLHQLFGQAYRPADPSSGATDAHGAANYASYLPLQDARTHNNSWGGDAAVFAANAIALDDFVWNHEDMVIVVSAGNDGTGSPATAGTVGSPATAKNDLTSAASANGDQPQVSTETIAAFSSHGPTSDGRFGPDLATPGQVVVSAKGSSADEEHYLQGTSMSGPLLTGLSTLVRQYFWDGYGPAGVTTSTNATGLAIGAPNVSRRFNPSSALVKAVLVNGAQRMRGWYSGDDGTLRSQDGQYPSNGQGFGLVSLDNSLYLPNDPTTLWVKDVWRDTFNGNTAAGGNPDAFPGPSASSVERSYTIHAEAGQPLDVTLAWIDAPSLAGSVPALVNNLNLTVTDPDGTTVRRGNNFNTRGTPKATAYETPAGGSADSKNNVERVRIDAPTTGDYTIKVTAPAINSSAAQGFALAASGRITASGSPALGSGWRVDSTPNAAPTVVSTTVENVSSDTAVVNVTTNELTKAVLTTSSGGIFRSVDVTGTGGFPNLPSAFNPEIPDTTGFPAAAGAHDMLTKQHRILVTGPRPGSVTMSVGLTDVEGKTSQVGVGTLPASATYQPALDDIAQFSSADGTYGGFNSKSTQMYLGQLTGLGNLIGTYKFGVPASVDHTTVGGAVVEATSGHDLVSHDAHSWTMRTDVLPDSVEANWRSNTYATINGATPVATLNPKTSVRKGGQSVYAQAVACNQLSALRTDLADKNIAMRMSATTDAVDSAVSFETGANRRSRGPQFRPRLTLLQEQGNGTVLDPRPCDPNAPAPVISDVRVEQNVLANGSSFNGVISWDTDVPSDSTVLIRPRGTGAPSWVEVSVPGRSTLHMVEVQGLSLGVDYEFVVNSASCNGANTTDNNKGLGYAFVDIADAPVAVVGGPYDFEADAQGWTPAREPHGDQPGDPPANPLDDWARETDAAHSPTHSFNVAPYHDLANATLTSPTFDTTVGRLRVSWWQRLHTEPDFDFVILEAKVGSGWAELGRWSGQTPGFANGDFEAKTVVFDMPATVGAQIRFRFESDSGVSSLPPDNYGGAWVDDVTISQGGRSAAIGPFPYKAASAKSSVGVPTFPFRIGPSAADLAAGTARCKPVTSQVFVPPVTPATPATPNGYWLTSADAGMFSYGDAKFVGSRGGQPLNEPVVGMAENKADHLGYWQVASDGGIFSYGSAAPRFFGSMGGQPLNKPIVGMAATPEGDGYWLVASDGGIFAYGTAASRFYGSMGGQPLNKPIVGMAVTPTGKGYWLVASDGGIFAFGDAVGRFYGSAGSLPLSSPVVGMEPTPAGDGYWLVAKDGGVFAYGAASGRFFGSMAGKGVNDIVGMASMTNGLGYWLAGANGGVYPFGQAPAAGSASGLKLVRPIVGIEGY